MIIDIHTHVGDLTRAGERTPVTWENLIARLDEEGIDKAVLLPLESPESIFPRLRFSPEGDPITQIRTAAARYRDRIIPFASLDPRQAGNSPTADFSYMIGKFVELGCVGVGEVTANLYFDDPRVVNMFRQCGEARLPLLFHGTGPAEGVYGLIDEVNSPHLERLLQAAPGATIIGHGPGFWAEIGGGIAAVDKNSYPRGPIAPDGSLPRLLREYPNLYADISAMSGYNALSRDEEFGVAFIVEFQDKLIFGTDVCVADQQGRMPHLSFLQRLLAENKIGQDVFDKIASGNALEVLTRYPATAPIIE